MALSSVGQISRLALPRKVEFGKVASRRQRVTHLLRRRIAAAAKLRVRQQCHLRLDTESGDLLDRQLGNFRERLGARIHIHVRVGDEYLSAGQNQAAHGAVNLGPGSLAVDLVDVAR